MKELRYWRGKLLAAALLVLAAFTVASCADHRQAPSAGAETNAGASAGAETAADPNGSTETLYLHHAQPKLQTMKLWIGTNVITAELAVNETEIATGMMFRKQMGEDEGMLFVFPQPYRTSFYMRNTYIPLSGAYIDPEGIIREIHPMKPLDESPIEAATDTIQYVLEMKQGWFERHHVPVGTAVATEKGTLSQTFFPGR